jgi:tRNA pseudouridine synthase 10
LQAYRLCQLCSERQGGEALGFYIVSVNECFICAGMMGMVSRMARAAARTARRYQFQTFSVGVSVPEGVQEREDELRSNLKLKGNETIKTQAARLVAGEVSQVLGRTMDRQRPDLSLLVDFGVGEASATSRPVFYYGRYTKPAGVSQRRELCNDCGGGGCKKCRNTGFELGPSVEGLLRRKLAGFSGSEKMTFSWLGSEDRDSKVCSPGRPFVADVKSPRKRKFPRTFGARFRGGTVSVSSGKILPSKPLRLPSFRFATKIRGTAASKVSAESLAELKTRFRRTEVRFERPHNRPTMKTVYRASATARGRTLFVDAELDGGLPVKRFVSGELVSPSVSEVLKTEVVCRSFDICRVRETGKFEFAEITRNEEKD